MRIHFPFVRAAWLTFKEIIKILTERIKIRYDQVPVPKLLNYFRRKYILFPS